MPLTFIDIERQKSWRIWLLFLALLLLYFVVCFALLAPILPHTVLVAERARSFWPYALLIAFFGAAVHFLLAGYDAVNRVMQSLAAQPPDPADSVHKMLLNIMQEIHVVTGNRRMIRCVVIPTLSQNALAAADLKGDAVIGITEGLLSRLKRPQIEAVVAHEAHHILSGDCLETTITASLFGSISSLLEKYTETRHGNFLHPVLWPAWLLLKLSLLLNMFISREREYRADAAAVRMTRNPVALAETLHLLSRNWRGAGFIGSGFEMICIVNPHATALDESEGFWANLLSTHPPVKKRIEILLSMARVPAAELEAAEKKKDRASIHAPGERYYAMSPQQLWQGPFTVPELAGLPWLSPLTWITSADQQRIDRAWQQPLINSIFLARLAGREKVLSDHICPVCMQQLIVSSCEGARILQCGFCAGALVENDKITRIIARTGRENPCSERINALARTEVSRNQTRHTRRMLNGGGTAVPLLACPRCKNPMRRSFYSSAHMIEVDRCGSCSLTWFDPDELAMLQCLIRNRIVPEVGLS